MKYAIEKNKNWKGNQHCTNHRLNEQGYKT